MNDSRVLELLAALSRDAADRRATARELAASLGAEDLLILLFDKEAQVYIPASGFPQTLPGGRLWRQFLAEIGEQSRAEADVIYPPSREARRARGWRAPDSSLLVLVGGEPDAERARGMLSLLPLVTPSFEKERISISSAAAAQLAQQTARQAHELAVALDDVRRKLQATVILRERDIERRQQIEAQLERSNQDLKRLNEDLTQFTYAATHDLREPLRMITVYAQFLQRRRAASIDAGAQRDLDHIVDGARRMGRLIDGLLQFSQVGEIEPAKAVRVEAQAAFDEALKDLELTLAENQARIECGGLPVVLAHPLYLRQVFQNLIANAVKYRKQGANPEIAVWAEDENEKWVFAVRDNGIGIAPEYHELIFLPLKRLHGSEIAGAGIGLATCKRIVERYGGRLWVQSQLSQGSVFYFSLPAFAA